MAYKHDEVGELIRVDTTESRARASRLILAAVREAHGHQRNASDALNVAESTLIRWVRQLDLKAKIEGIRTRATKRGTYARGRPRKDREWKAGT